MANFNQSERPKTVPSQPSRPLVPSPYFFRYYSTPYNKMSLSAKSGKIGTGGSKFESKYFVSEQRIGFHETIDLLILLERNFMGVFKEIIIGKMLSLLNYIPCYRLLSNLTYKTPDQVTMSQA